ncbi:MAG: hypothetical protein JSS06_00355 [Proteobacteria bacterium]|nr:hypothetical protein [Pseudomonadota bacterium]
MTQKNSLDTDKIWEKGPETVVEEVLKKIASEGQAKRNRMEKRSLQRVNKHFKSDFNAAWPSAVVFQSFLRMPRLLKAELYVKMVCFCMRALLLIAKLPYIRAYRSTARLILCGCEKS